MKSSTARRLLRLNQEFYDRFAVEFAASRANLQPGIVRALAALGDFGSVLDVGCGDGRVTRALAALRRPIRYCGLDASARLIELARLRPAPASIRASYVRAEITGAEWGVTPPRGGFDCAVMFAVLHHIPGRRRRARVLRRAAAQVRPGGRLALSVWQFLSDDRLRRKIAPWSLIGLRDSDVDDGDYLLDWKRGGEGLRYCCLLTEEDVISTATAAGCEVVEMYRSDGRTGALSLYTILRYSGRTVFPS